ncbi:MAG: hypothetical protein GY845_15950 [Planctomycetes bacterium]|nr:hypothetical protein [Planctomycetota bacterium]
MRFKKLALRLCLSLASILVCLISLEVAVRGYKRLFRPPPSPPLHIVVDSPILYGLNPEHSEINSLGLRDDEVPISKPEGTLRILILGDSVTYGMRVSKNKAFPNHLESLLRKQFRTAEVINAGVWGYTAYNELQYYLTKGREFEPDIVIVAFCMNDVVNPRLHWGYTKENIINIPDQAIPNHAYDLNHVLPKMQQLKEREQSLWKYSALYNVLEWRVARLFQRKARDIPNFESKISTFITGEDTLSIEVLLDETSPEWRWLTSIYSQLQAAVRADQATLIVALFPLAYQLDEHYPFLPQIQIGEYCKQNSILYIDLLELFRQHPKESIFLLRNSNYPKSNDIWHLTEYGHELCAEEILRFLQERKLLLIENNGD